MQFLIAWRVPLPQVIIAFATEGQLLELLVEAAHRNLTRRQWVASEAWVTAKLLTIPELHPVLAGTVGFPLEAPLFQAWLSFSSGLDPHLDLNLFSPTCFGRNCWM